MIAAAAQVKLLPSSSFRVSHDFQPTLAKLMDVFGRFEVMTVSVIFYIIGWFFVSVLQTSCYILRLFLGTIVEATSNNVKSFAGGAILYQVGRRLVSVRGNQYVSSSILDRVHCNHASY